ncbi:hypothetical protein CKM354_000547300 [Cercospora kikuchii]|uniref:Uncharacterized protein n=1 Tax=Cercospora kikuchii TaxID=84275 RepID=A0A9P3FH91_9PEZI|nr:uncharacterized protein CKM354_000547300 [Cercospora kikuchii]GIZ42195.1 hypothetical protein CKM354_000547300 [Cercospora kikuchii]
MDPTFRLLLTTCLLPFVVGQSNNDGEDLSESIYGTSTSTPAGTASSTSTAQPTESNEPQRESDMDSLVNYYFVFLALIVILVGIGAFFVYRRKRKIALLYQNGQAGALQQDVGAWDPSRARRRYWQGRWRSTDVTDREEGLNEHGEAPPPYMPKETRDEEQGLPMRNHNDNNNLAVPLQTLSREQAGLKPPEYDYAVTEHYARPSATGSTSSSQQPTPEPWSQQQHQR